jgi:hypothetical protein
MMCIISKERIAYYAQVEATRGEGFEVSPIAVQSQGKRLPNELIPTYGHSWISTPDCPSKIVDPQSEKKWWICDERAICNAMRGIDARHRVSRHRYVSDGSDRPHPLWRSHSAQMELFFADVPSSWHTTGFQKTDALVRGMVWNGCR